MQTFLEFRVGDPNTCEMVVERAGGADEASGGLTISIFCYASGTCVGPRPFSLPLFLKALRLTAADCAAALEAQSSPRVVQIAPVESDEHTADLERRSD